MVHLPRRLAAVCLASCLVSAALGQVASNHEPGVTVWGTNKYVEYIPGTAPVILGSPHGGDLKPPGIRDRTWGALVQDGRTQETTRALADAVARLTGRRPHVVISHLHRIKLDPNRAIDEAAQGNLDAELAWAEFHGFLDAAKATVAAGWGRGLYAEIHGHAHPEARVELGYALGSADLAQPDSVLDWNVYVEMSTLRALGFHTPASFSALVRGPTSLGAGLEARGYATVPAPGLPDPMGAAYFGGGYGVQRHGSRDGGTIDAIQIELPPAWRFLAADRERFGDDLAAELAQLFLQHYAMTPASDPRVGVAALDGVATETGSRASFVISRTGVTSSPLTVSYVIEGSATAGADFVPLPATATFAPGADAVEVEIIALDDAISEGPETVVLRLVGGIEVGARGRAEVLLLDDEPDPFAALRLDFDEVGGPLALDATGHGRSGTLRPSAAAGPQRVPGFRGGALAFDAADDHVTVADFPFAAGGACSVSFLFSTVPGSGTGCRYILSQGDVGQPESLNIYLCESTGALRTALSWANDLSAIDVLDVDEDLRDGQWHRYVLTTTRGDLSHVYIDGVLAASAMLTGDVLDPSAPITIGGRGDLSASRFYGGELDELAIHDRALSAEEVRRMWSGLEPDAAVYPGSGLDLALASGVDGPATSGALRDVKRAGAGEILSIELSTPLGTFAGISSLLGLQPIVTGTPPTPLLPELWLLPSAIAATAIVPLPWPAPLVFSTVIPGPGLEGLSLLLQGLVLTAAAPNGIFGASPAHEIRIE